ncbi:hypothetical protein [Marinicrinis lubricantis]|uniref:Uncharacterized protein n=1 Tax=Marinicrinis lubricantis TaxID=2086470 RepID=A0ABW1ITL5_9BACL
MKKARKLLSLFLVLGLMSSVLASTAYAAESDQTTQYRVFQNDKLLKEFASRAQAVAYAQYFANSYVEDVVTRTWVWSSFPTYQVIVDGQPLAHRFYTYDGALTEAKKHKRSIVKDLTKAGIMWDNYPEYRLYQGDKTLPEWEFATLEEAKKAAAYYRNVHVIKLLTNQWVWDDMTEAQKNTYRQQKPVYEVTAPTLETSRTFAFLQDAIREAYKYDDSVIMNTSSGKQVYSNSKEYVVKQSGREIQRFYHPEMAIRYARNFVRASIEWNGKELWYNDPTYIVLQSDRAVGSFHTVQDAVK